MNASTFLFASPAPQKRASAVPPLTERTERTFHSLHQRLSQAGYRGYEFDDFLGSPLVRLLAGGNLFLQRCWVQVGELFPINLRPALGVPKRPSTKASAYVARALLNHYRATGSAASLEAANERLDWLAEHRSPGVPGIGWGNDFDFASRGGFYPKGLPTVVWTAHGAEAFELAFALTRDPRRLEVLRGCGEFVLKGLERHEDSRGVCIAYAPGLVNLVHNSNLLGAATLLRCHRRFGVPGLLKTAKRAIRWSLSQQNSDGSWFYGAGDTYAWIDNFHTAYVIDALVVAHDVGGDDVVPWSAIQRSVDFWRRHFFLPDGTPKYYAGKTFPLDIQCASQAIETASRLTGRFPELGEVADRVLDWTLRRMLKRNGAFRYQIRKFWVNNLESLHWGQGTMLSALGAYLAYRNAKRSV